MTLSLSRMGATMKDDRGRSAVAEGTELCFRLPSLRTHCLSDHPTLLAARTGTCGRPGWGDFYR